MLGFILSHFREKLNFMSNQRTLSMLWKESLSFLAFLHTPPAPARCWRGAKHRRWGSLHDPQHNGLLSRLQPCAEHFPSLVDKRCCQIHLELGWAAPPDGMAAAKWASLPGKNALLLWLPILQGGQIHHSNRRWFLWRHIPKCATQQLHTMTVKSLLMSLGVR